MRRVLGFVSVLLLLTNACAFAQDTTCCYQSSDLNAVQSLKTTLELNGVHPVVTNLSSPGATTIYDIQVPQNEMSRATMIVEFVEEASAQTGQDEWGGEHCGQL